MTVSMLCSLPSDAPTASHFGGFNRPSLAARSPMHGYLFCYSPGQDLNDVLCALLEG